MSIRKLDDGRYEWRHRVGGRHLKKVFVRRDEAVKHDAKVRADLARGTHVDTTSRTTVAEYAREWVEARVIRPSSRRARETFLRHHLDPTPLGARPIVKVRPSEVQAWITGRAAVLGPVTLHAYVGVLRAVFASAVLDGVLARNPVQPESRLSLPRRDKPKFVPLTVAQVRAWAAVAGPRVRAMIITQAALGLRISELRALRVQDVDFLRREVRVDAQLDPRGCRAPLKTANSRRVVPLPAVAADALAAHIRQFPPADGGEIFTSTAGRPWQAGKQIWKLYHASAVAARTCGKPPADPAARGRCGERCADPAHCLPDGTSSHDLRHHYASVLLAAGESVHAVAERLGDSPAMVLDVYGHVMPDQEDTTRRAVDAAWKQDAAAASQASR